MNNSKIFREILDELYLFPDIKKYIKDTFKHIDVKIKRNTDEAIITEALYELIARTEWFVFTKYPHAVRNSPHLNIDEHLTEHYRLNMGILELIDPYLEFLPYPNPNPNPKQKQKEVYFVNKPFSQIVLTGNKDNLELTGIAGNLIDVSHNYGAVTELFIQSFESISIIIKDDCGRTHDFHNLANLIELFYVDGVELADIEYSNGSIYVSVK